MKYTHLLGLALAVLVAGCSTTSTATTTNTTNTTTVPTLGFASPVSKILDAGAGGGTKGQLSAIADFNGDGLPDIAVANPATHTVSVFINSGNGTFNTETKFAGPSSGPLAIAVGDFDASGKPDIVVVGTNQVSYLLNDGTGAFPTHQDLTIGTNNTCLVVADLDGDGFPDAAVSDAGGANQLHVVFGNGGNLATNYAVIDYTTNAGTVTSPQWISVGDFNADGKPDLVFASAGASYLTLWLNNSGASRPALFPNGNTFNSGLGLPNTNLTGTVAVGDFDGDGRPDVFTPSFAGTVGTAQVIVNKTSGFANASGNQQGMSFNPTGAAVADFNQDGFLDAVAVSANGNNGNGTGEADIFAGNGQGGLSTLIAYPGISNQVQASVSVGDLNNDGRPDIVMAGPGAMTILINTSAVVTQ